TRAYRLLASLPTRRSSDLQRFADDVLNGGSCRFVDVAHPVAEDVEEVGQVRVGDRPHGIGAGDGGNVSKGDLTDGFQPRPQRLRSEEHTSELQSRENLVCR